jgi:hypothetical protein
VKPVAITLVLFIALGHASLFFAQTNLPANSPPNSPKALEMTAIGNGEQFGRGAAFRTYQTPDHTEALVWYGQFPSEQAAKHEMKQCLENHKITHKEVIKDLNGRVIGTRIVATPKRKQKAFMVIQKQGLSYWIIRSISLEVATQVAGLIEPPSHDRK